MHRGLREDENIVFRELKNSRILKTLCTHFNDTWEAGETRDERKRSWHAVLWSVYFIPKRIEVIKARNT